MKKSNETIEDFDIVQNIAVGAMALWEFAKEYYDVSLHARPAVLPLFMPVLPLVFHRRSVENFGGRNFSGGFYRALQSDRTMSAGLQERMEQMAEKTLDAVVLACAGGLLNYDPESASLTPVIRTLPRELRPESIRPLLGTAKRLGHWFGELGVEQTLGLLRIRF